MDKKIIQITAGCGPVECSRVVALVLALMLKDAGASAVDAVLLDKVPGDMNGTLLSATLSVASVQLDDFIARWQGTVQWIAQSPYRRFHKRKNWYVGVDVFDVTREMTWRDSDVVFDTCLASGPGGQHVNKVETAVRGLHKPSGIQVLAMDSRSQLQNKKICLERLKAKVESQYLSTLAARQQSQWQQHHALERGNPVRTITRPL